MANIKWLKYIVNLLWNDNHIRNHSSWSQNNPRVTFDVFLWRTDVRLFWRVISLIMKCTKQTNSFRIAKRHILIPVKPPTKKKSKIFCCAKSFVFEFYRESIELFLSYHVHFCRYRQFWTFWHTSAKQQRNC